MKPLEKLAQELEKLSTEKVAHEFDLKYMAKKAADEFLKSERPLTQTISELAKEASLNSEEIKRVCEYANNDVYQSLFDREQDKHIHFDVADSSSITDVEKTASMYEEISDYNFSPSYYKKSLEKVAHVEKEEDISYLHSNPKDDLLDLREKYQYLQDTLFFKEAAASTELPILFNKIVKEAEALLESYPYYSIAQALTEGTTTADLLEEVTVKLTEKGLIGDEDFYAIVKTAGKLNSQHPLITQSQKYEKLASEVLIMQEALKDVDAKLEKIAQLLK